MVENTKGEKLKRMKKLKFKYKVIIMAAFLVCVSSVCYGMAAPQLTRSLFVQWSDMQEVAPNVYVNPQMSKEKRQDLLKEMNAAKKRVIDLFGSIQATPTIILSDSKDVSRRYTAGSAQTYSTVLGSIIVLGPEGLDPNIISHELTHAELHHRVGKIIPAWFDEGLATMVDGRYAAQLDEQWQKLTENGKKTPDFTKMVTHDQFEKANRNVITTYILSCYEVSHWYEKVGKNEFHRFIKDIADGRGFAETYTRSYK